MRIGFMLRNLRERGGIKVYTVNLIEELIGLESGHEFVFLYDHPSLLGTYAGRRRVEEVLVRFPTRLGWDQIAVPLAARRLDLDLIVNPKLSVPLLSGRPSVFTLHGAEQFAVRHVFRRHDRLYTRLMMPLFCRHAAAIISTTQMGIDDIVGYVGADRRKLHPVHEAAHARFRPLDPADLAAVKERYRLPDRFILFVGGLSPLKNFANLLRALAWVGGDLAQPLVAVGFRRWKYAADVALIEKLGLEDRVMQVGFVPDEDLPAFYNLASLLVLPSLYEGFGIPILEAMACGCPVVTSRTGCGPEVAGKAAVLVDPYRPEDIAAGISRVLADPALAAELARSGREQAAGFSWRKAARESLAVYEAAQAARPAVAGHAAPAASAARPRAEPR